MYRILVQKEIPEEYSLIRLTSTFSRRGREGGKWQSSMVKGPPAFGNPNLVTRLMGFKRQIASSYHIASKYQRISVFLSPCERSE